MQSIAYQYASATDPNPSRFAGQIKTERYWDGVSGHENNGVAVSTLTSHSMPGDNKAATQTETRGDGPSRTLYIEKGAHNVPPLVKRKSDFNGVNEQYTYDNNNYLLTARDRNGNLTTYTNEPVIGNPTQIVHNSDNTHIDYSYSDNANPYHIHTVSDELGKVTTYTRSGVPGTNLANLITRIDYPSDNQTPQSYEEFTYNSFGQVLTHHLRNVAYESFAYSGSLLTDRWNPKQTGVPGGNDPHIHYDYYTSEYSGAWKDRVKTVTYPANWTGLVATETYEYDRALGGDGITNPNGTPVHGRGLVTKITYADNKFKAFTYDKFGNKRSETDETNHTTLYTYDDYKRLKTVTRVMSPAPNEVTTYYYTATNGASPYSHATNSVRQTHSPTTIVTGQTYDNNFRLATRIESEGHINATTRFGYDNNGNQTRVTDPRGGYLGDPQYTTITSYDNRNRKWHVTDPQGHQTTFSYQGGSNNVIDILRPDGTHETKTYDAMHRVLTDTVPRNNPNDPITTWFTYNPSGTLQNVTDARGSGPGNPSYYTTSFQYDASDLKTRMTYPNQSYRQWLYDNVHNLQYRRTPGGKYQYFSYDIRNRREWMWWNDSVEWVNFVYDDAGRVTWAYNGTGDPNTNLISTVARHYDLAGRVDSEWQNVNGLGPKGIGYIYNPDGSLHRMYVAGAGTTYDYIFLRDWMARFEKIWPGGANPISFQYYYDAASNETQRYNNLNGVTELYTRDELNRMTRLDVKKGAMVIGREDYGYDPMSRLVSVTREDNKQDQFVYYLDGELKTVAYGATPTPTPSPGMPFQGNCADVTFSVTGGCPYAQLVSMSTTTGGATIFYTNSTSAYVTPTHDGGTPTGSTLVYSGPITIAAGTASYISAVAYKSDLPDSNVTQTFADNSCLTPNGDPNATPPPEAVPTPDTNWTPEATPTPYEAPPEGTPPEMTPPPNQTPPPTPPPSETPPALDSGKEQKTVDDFISLKMDPEPMVPAARNVTYNLDKMGNRMSVTDSVNGNTSYTPNNLNEYSAVAGTPVPNGPEHEIDQYGNVTYTYRHDEQLTSATSGSGVYTLAYDALGRCVKRTFNNSYTKFYIYDGEKPILEYDAASGNLIARNVYGKGIDEILMRTDYTFNPPAGVTFYPQQDHEGSVTHLTDVNGAVIERYRYDVFGAPTIYPPPAASPTPTPRQASIVSNRFLFTGREYAAAFGFYEYRARAYHPGLGRFTSEDPKLFEAGDYNLYRYCHNDPLDLTDPMGLENLPGEKPPPPPPPPQVQVQRLTRSIDSRIPRWQTVASYTLTAEASTRHSTPVGDRQVFSALRNKYNEVSAAHLDKMSIPQFWRFQRDNNTAPEEFYNPKTYQYQGALTALQRYHGGVYSGHDMNYMAVGEGFAARGVSTEKMATAIVGWRYGILGPSNVLHGRPFGGLSGGEYPWALVGYYYYQGRSAGMGY